MKRDRKFFGEKMIFVIPVVLLGLALIFATVTARSAGVVVESGEYRLISHSASGEIGNSSSSAAVISEDGNVVAFMSGATNLVEGDTNGVADVFVVDLVGDTIERVSISSTGEQGNGNSYKLQLSSDGRYVAFVSLATNLTEEESDSFSDVYLVDRQEDTIVKISESFSGASANGDSYVHDISANDQFVVLISYASNLVEGDTDGVGSIFLYEIATGIVSMVEVTPAGVVPNGSLDDPKISGDGRYLTFKTSASNLVANDTNGRADIFLFDRTTGEVELISKGNDGTPCENGCYSPDISSDGNWVVFSSYSNGLVPEDDDGKSDVFLYDVVNDDLSLLTTGTGGYDYEFSGDGDMIDAIGRRTIYYSWRYEDIGNLDDRYIGRTRWYGPFMSDSYTQDISADGERIVFKTRGTVIPEYSSSGTQIYLHDVSKTPLLDEECYPYLEEEHDGDPTPELLIWSGLLNVDTYTVQIYNADTDTKVFEETINDYDACAPQDYCGLAIDQILPDGAYHWRVKGANTSEETDWSEWKDFTVISLSTPEPRFPKNDYEITVGTTTLKWAAINNATQYELELLRPDGSMYDHFTVTTDACADGVCQYKLPYKLDVEYGSWSWKVRGLNGGVVSTWSDTAVFNYAQLDTFQLQSPADAAVVSTSTPTFTWNASTQNVFRYDLEIWALDGSLAAAKSFAASAVCSDGTCTWTADAALSDGVYTWHVLGKKFPNNSGWSASGVFTVDTAGGASGWTGLDAGDAFSAPVTKYPKNDHEITAGTSLIKWGPVDGASSYVLELYNPAGDWYDAWEIASSVCDETTCEYKLPYKLGTEFGIWSWRVRAKDGLSVGSWSSSASFNYIQVDLVHVSSPVEDAVLSVTRPTFVWEDSTQSLFKYVIEIWTADGTLVVTQSLSAGAVCSDGTCSWQSTSFLLTGEYKWRVLGKKWPNSTGWTEMETFTIAD